MKHVRNTSLSVVLLLSMLCASCGSKVTVPKDIVQPDKMVDILEEVYMLEGFFSTQTHFRFDTFRAEMTCCFDSIYSKYDVSQQLFDTSFSWYTSHPDLFKPIFDSVVNRLVEVEANLPSDPVTQNGSNVVVTSSDEENDISDVFF